jgi:endonuclease/exonuclease/phosphatase (EEP) superfamily protein YafD
VTAVASPAAAARRPRRRFERAWLLWLLVAGLAVWALARGVGFDHRTPFAQATSYTPYVGAVSTLVFLGTVAARQWKPALAGGLVVLVFAAFLLPRAIPAGAPTDGVRLRVLAFNAKLGGASVRDLMALLRREQPDVVSVEELTPKLVTKLTAAGIASSLPYSAVRPDLGATGTGLWARYPLTDARRMDPASGGFDQTFAVLRRPGKPAVEIGSAHPRPPLPQAEPYGSTHRWVDDISHLPSAPETGPIRILAGDYNATLDHSPLRKLISTGYLDAADERGAGLVSTWPEDGTRLPPVTIDHILVDKRAAVAAYRTHKVPGSDHKAIVADLALPQ